MSATASSQRGSPRPASSTPVYASFASEKIIIAAGVAIFHIATERVVVCFHSRDKFWFLPKGRRDASEETGRAAEREGFEEVSWPAVSQCISVRRKRGLVSKDRAAFAP